MVRGEVYYIDLTGNSKRRVCEQEIDEDEILPFRPYDATVERTLKEYVEKHEGNSLRWLNDYVEGW